MLVLTRKLGEAILIGDNIRVVVTHIDATKVRLAFEAPQEVVILRSEVKENREGGNP